MSGRATRRLYFALWPDDATRAAVVACAAEALASAGGRAVPAANLHVTLAFLGDVPAARVGDAVAAARSIVALPGVQAFDRLATWGRIGPLVLEASHVAPALGGLRDALSNSLIAADFELDRRAFRPHITLARRTASRWPPTGPSGPVAVVEWPWRAFALVESETHPEGSRYAVLESFAAA